MQRDDGMTRRGALAAGLASLGLGGAAVAGMVAAAPGAAPGGGPAGRPVVVELFTSQGCSSCPPADALLRVLARERGDVLALAFHVTYWDRLGWPDRFALAEATARQRGYAGISGIGGVYTPQMVVDGVRDVVGSDRPRVLAAIARAGAAAGAGVAVGMAYEAAEVAVTLGDRLGGAGGGAGKVLLVGFDPEHRTAVRRGENAGRELVEANIVRSVVGLGEWTGGARMVRVARPAGERHAVLVQAGDGRMLGVGVLG